MVVVITATPIAMVGHGHSVDHAALAGLEFTHYQGVTISLGVGWNFGFIGATAMVTDCQRLPNAARRRAQTTSSCLGRWRPLLSSPARCCARRAAKPSTG